MTPLYVLDTDHITLLQHNHPTATAHIASLPAEYIAVTIISAMEQIRGRLAQVNKAKRPSDVVNAFARFHEALHFYRTVSVLPYDTAAAQQFFELRKLHTNRPGTQDLRIASIIISRNAVLVTRNRRDFERIENLQFEDWSVKGLD